MNATVNIICYKQKTLKNGEHPLPSSNDVRHYFGMIFITKPPPEAILTVKFTIGSFENGSSTGITLASFIKLLRAIDFLDEIEKLQPELPENPRAI